MVRVSDLPEKVAQGVAERVVALIVDALDVNALLADVDIDALIDRIDVATLLDRVDIDALLARIDVAALLERVDIDTLIDRIDVEQLVTRIDVASTMAGTATSVAEDALAALRRTAARGDELTGAWADRLIGRR